MTLHIVATDTLEQRDLVGGFRPFGDHLHAEVVGQVNHCLNDVLIAFVGAHCADKAAVDLERIQGIAVQVVQGRVAGAEVVKAKAYAKPLQFAQDEGRALWFFHGYGLGQLQPQASSIQPGLAQSLGH